MKNEMQITQNQTKIRARSQDHIEKGRQKRYKMDMKQIGQGSL
jgi:hypothetical protein